jgi:lipoyl(octanoyl) transferase
MGQVPTSASVRPLFTRLGDRSLILRDNRERLLRENLRLGLWSPDEVVWETSTSLVAYEEAVRAMDRHVLQIRQRIAPERVWLLEHPPIYTAGTSAIESDLVDPRFPVHRSGRGGQYN